MMKFMNTMFPTIMIRNHRIHASILYWDPDIILDES